MSGKRNGRPPVTALIGVQTVAIGDAFLANDLYRATRRVGTGSAARSVQLLTRSAIAVP